jgi:polygalacturonase
VRSVALLGYVPNSKTDTATAATAAIKSPLNDRDCTRTIGSTFVINAKDEGAKGDGRSDDTAPIQSAIDQAARTGGTVLLPSGTYMVDAVGKRRLTLKSDVTLKLSKRAVLKAIPNSSEHYSLLTISGVTNVNVVGGTLEGERKHHKGKSGEWGMGIFIDRGAKHVTISGVTSKNMWGDGFYVGGAKDVKFCSVTADNNRRQGLSIVEADEVLVRNSVFRATRGTRPSAGIDLESDSATQKITKVRIEDSKFLDNAGAGIQIGGRGQIADVGITRNEFTRNRGGGIYIVGKRSRVSRLAIGRNVFRSNRRIIIKKASAVLASSICGHHSVAYVWPPNWLPWPEERHCG